MKGGKRGFILYRDEFVHRGGFRVTSGGIPAAGHTSLLGSPPIGHTLDPSYLLAAEVPRALSPCLYSRKTSATSQPFPEHNQTHSSPKNNPFLVKPKGSYMLNTALLKTLCDSFQVLSSGRGIRQEKEFRDETRAGWGQKGWKIHNYHLLKGG